MRRRSLLTAGVSALAAALGFRPAASAQPAPAAPPEALPAPQPAAPVEPPPQAVLRDGVRLALGLQRPQDADRSPAIVALTLDRRRDADPDKVPLFAALLAAGYAVVAPDLRGRDDSEGDWRAFDDEQHARDAVDLSVWAAAQPWCDGRVGLLAYGETAAAGLAAAAEGPAALKALVLWGGLRDRPAPDAVSPPASGGVVRLIDQLSAAAGDAASDLARRAKAGQDDAATRAALETLRMDSKAVYAQRPLLAAPQLRSGPLRERLLARLDGARREAPVPTWERIAIPVLQVCGWYAPGAWSQIAAFGALQQRAGSDTARAGQRLVVGPWASGLAFGRRLGEMAFGARGDSAGSGLDAQVVGFLDAALGGREPAAPPVRYFVMGANAWREAPTWPPPGAQRLRLYLHSHAKANSVAGDGALVPRAPGGQPPDRFVFDPAEPTPTLGGAAWGQLTGEAAVGPREQTPVARRYDVLCYTTAPFDTDVELCGPAVVRLAVATTATDADFVAKLVQVYPDGAAVNLCEGALRLSGRDRLGAPQPVTPGDVYEITFAVGQTATVIGRGGRLRLQVASADYPLFDQAAAADAAGPATQTVHHQRRRPSWVEVTVTPSNPAA